MFSGEELAAFFTVVGVNIGLSGDNAIVIATAAAGLPESLRRKAISFGVIFAAVARILFSLVAFYLLKIIGLLLIGGLLLLWVAWTMWRQIRAEDAARAARAAADEAAAEGEEATNSAPATSFRKAIFAIVVADVSMSLDNVLAVVGAAQDHFMIMVFGLILSIALMGVAADFIARLMNRFRWIAYIGVALILYVGIDMMWRGGVEVAHYFGWFAGTL